MSSPFPSPSEAEFSAAKRAIRMETQRKRRRQPDADALSHAILDTCLKLPEVVSAHTLMFYLDVRDEVRTQHALPRTLASDRRVVVPWCQGPSELQLFLLTDLQELEAGRFGILEPSAALRRLPEKQIQVSELDAIFVPGVAFDRHGGRLGYGKGYFDRLLKTVRPDCALTGLAFECQLCERVPMDSHDVYMDWIVTEQAIYRGTGRGLG